MMQDQESLILILVDSDVVTHNIAWTDAQFISKKIFLSGGMAPLEWTCSFTALRAVGDTLVADYSMPGINMMRHFEHRPPITVSPFFLGLCVSYLK